MFLGSYLRSSSKMGSIGDLWPELLIFFSFSNTLSVFGLKFSGNVPWVLSQVQFEDAVNRSTLTWVINFLNFSNTLSIFYVKFLGDTLWVLSQVEFEDGVNQWPLTWVINFSNFPMILAREIFFCYIITLYFFSIGVRLYTTTDNTTIAFTSPRTFSTLLYECFIVCLSVCQDGSDTPIPLVHLDFLVKIFRFLGLMHPEFWACIFSVPGNAFRGQRSSFSLSADAISICPFLERFISF